MSLPSELDQAVRYLKQGVPEAARPILVRYLQNHPRSDVGWYLLSFAVPEHSRQVECLQRALRLNPGNAKARERLSSLTGTAAVNQPPSFSTSQTDRGVPSPRPGAARSGPRMVGRGMASSRRLARQWPPWVKPTLIVGSSLLILMAIGGAIAFISFMTGTFGARADAQSTAQAGTATARATLGASVGLPPTWTPEPSNTPEPTQPATLTPTATLTPSPVPPSTQVLSQMSTIEAQVADLRGLPIEGTPPAYLISAPKVRPFLEASFAAGGGTEAKIHDMAHVLVALGLTKPTYDLYTNILNGLTDSVGGFYLPWTKEIFVIGTSFSGVERWVFSHEFDHALVDQHYHIDQAGVYPLCERTEDACNAIQALVEGDATLLMSQWFGQYATRSDILDVTNYKPPQHTLPEDSPPPYAGPNALFPYDQGTSFVDYLYNRGNWAEVNRAYQNLPASTEQILHPEKYLRGEAPVDVNPRDLGPTLGENWRSLASDTLGEWTSYLLLAYNADNASQLDSTQAQQAAAGWGGDNYQVYYDDATQSTVLAAQWTWDTATDAGEFDTALGEVLNSRYRGGVVEGGRGKCWAANGEESCLLTGHNSTLWIETPQGDLMDRLIALYPEFN